MSDDGSVTHWLRQLPGRDPEAAEQLWRRYFRRLVALARCRLRGADRRLADEEDVALSAFDSFCRGAEQGRFPRLADRDNLWSLLVVITARKAANQRRDQQRLKRGGPEGAGRRVELADVVGREPDPAFAAEVADECRRLLGSLGDDVLRSVAVAKMEGHTNAEIADRLGCAPRTVERKLGVIRGLWDRGADR